MFSSKRKQKIRKSRNSKSWRTSGRRKASRVLRAVMSCTRRCISLRWFNRAICHPKTLKWRTTRRFFVSLSLANCSHTFGCTLSRLTSKRYYLTKTYTWTITCRTCSKTEVKTLSSTEGQRAEINTLTKVHELKYPPQNYRRSVGRHRIPQWDWQKCNWRCFDCKMTDL